MVEADRVFIHVQETESEAECVRERVSHIIPDIHYSTGEGERPQAADKYIIMILCAVDLKVLGLSNHWIVKHRTEPEDHGTCCLSTG